MKAVDLIGDVDAEHCLRVQVPEDVLVPEQDHAEEIWMRAIASEWSDELSDARQDLYTLEDGLPLDGAR